MMPADDFLDLDVFALSAPDPEPAPEPDAEPPAAPPPLSLYERLVLIEGVDGAPPFDGPIVVQWKERTFTHAGVDYEHVSEHHDGRWVYREM